MKKSSKKKAKKKKAAKKKRAVKTGAGRKKAKKAVKAKPAVRQPKAPAKPAGRQMYLNLAVKDLPRSKAFFQALGFSINPEFTDEKAACLVVEDNIFVMLLTQEFFQGFIKTQIADTATTTEALVGISAPSRQAVDTLVDAAMAQGATPVRDPEDHGFMYGRTFHDLDGHIWEVVWMDMEAFRKARQAAPAGA